MALENDSKKPLKQSLYFVMGVFIAAFIVSIVLTVPGSSIPYGKLFFPIYQLGLLLFSMYLGLSPAHWRPRRLMHTMLPRLAALIACFLLYLLFLTGPGQEDAGARLFAPAILLGCALVLFFTGLSFSVRRGSVIVPGLAAAVIFGVFIVVLKLLYPLAAFLKLGVFDYFNDLLTGLDWWGMPAPVYFAAAGFITALASSFIYAARRFDPNAPRQYIKKYFTVFIPVISIVLAVSLVWLYGLVSRPWENYYLTANHKLIRHNNFHTCVYDQTTVHKIEAGYIYPDAFLEREGYLYTTGYTGRDSGVLAIDLETLAVKTLYRSPAGMRLHRRAYAYKDTIAFINKNIKTGDRLLILYQLKKNTMKTIRVRGQLKRKHYYMVVFGAGEIEGKEFWLIYTGFYQGWQMLRAWEDRTVERLGISGMIPFYADGMLISGDSKTMEFRKITAAGLELIKVLPGEKGIEFQGALRSLDHRPGTEVYAVVRENASARDWQKALRLDLERFGFSRMQPPVTGCGGFHYVHPGVWYFTHEECGPAGNRRILKALYRLEKGMPVLLRKFDAIDLMPRRGNFFNLYAAGLVLKRDGQTRVFGLPDLKEIHFKKLK
jgi:hypothetical protein